MSRVEELPDDFEEAMDISKIQEGPSMEEWEASYARRFAKPGADKAPANQKSFEEAMSEISRTPLFMNSLEDAGDNGMPLPWSLAYNLAED